VAAITFQNGIAAASKFLDRKKFFRRARGDERDGILRNFGHQAAEAFFGALIGE
jgi:hypothetical protein